MRLHLACVSSGTYGPFATSASRSRLRLPRTTRLALRASLAGSESRTGHADVDIPCPLVLNNTSLSSVLDDVSGPCVCRGVLIDHTAIRGGLIHHAAIRGADRVVLNRQGDMHGPAAAGYRGDEPDEGHQDFSLIFG